MSLKEKSAVVTGGKRARQWPQELARMDRRNDELVTAKFVLVLGQRAVWPGRPRLPVLECDAHHC